MPPSFILLPHQNPFLAAWGVELEALGRLRVPQWPEPHPCARPPLPRGSLPNAAAPATDAAASPEAAESSTRPGSASSPQDRPPAAAVVPATAASPKRLGGEGTSGRSGATTAAAAGGTTQRPWGANSSDNTSSHSSSLSASNHDPRCSMTAAAPGRIIRRWGSESALVYPEDSDQPIIPIRAEFEFSTTPNSTSSATSTVAPAPRPGPLPVVRPHELLRLPRPSKSPRSRAAAASANNGGVFAGISGGICAVVNGLEGRSEESNSEGHHHYIHNNPNHLPSSPPSHTLISARSNDRGNVSDYDAQVSVRFKCTMFLIFFF